MLQEGDVFKIKEGDKVYADVPQSLVYSNRKGDWSLTHTLVAVAGELAYLAGKYVVTKTAFEGGSDGRDPYPNGHHVYAVAVEGKHKVDFYQSGCFTAMIPDRAAIGRATMKWVVEEDE